MEIYEFGKDVWNSFVVVLDRKREETDNQYLGRLFDYVIQFYKRNTIDNPPMRNPFWHLERGKEFGGNFCDFRLEDKFHDVKFFSNHESRQGIPEGLLVNSHRDENKKESVKFIKELWRVYEPEQK